MIKSIDLNNVYSQTWVVQRTLDKIASSVEVLEDFFFADQEEETIEHLAFMGVKDALVFADSRLSEIRDSFAYDVCFLQGFKFDPEENVLHLKVFDADEQETEEELTMLSDDDEEVA